MTKEERKTKLHTLTGYILSKCNLINDSVNHKCFIIKPRDVIYIVDEYKDILMSSNLHMSRWSEIGRWSFNTTDFNVTADEYSFRIKQAKEYDRFNNFEVYVELDKTTEIEVDISCETILSIHFKHSNIKFDELFSFRND